MQTGPVFIKDLRRLGRSLSHTIIIDNMAANFQLQTENGIFIKGWFGDEKDRALIELAPMLIEIVRNRCNDVREALKEFRGDGLRNEDPNLNLSSII